MKPTEKLLQAIAVTAELTGTQMSAIAAKVMAEDLARYPEAWVMGALVRCRRELLGRLTLAEVIRRMDDGRPGPEEAWAMCPRDEATSVVWSDEMRAAWAVADTLLQEGDEIAARMAFLERYRALVQAARDAGIPPHWEPSLGHDPHGRERVLREAVERKRLTASHAALLLPHHDEPNPKVVSLFAPETPKQIEDRTTMPGSVRDQLRAIVGKK